MYLWSRFRRWTGARQRGQTLKDAVPGTRESEPIRFWASDSRAAMG